MTNLNETPDETPQETDSEVQPQEEKPKHNNPKFFPGDCCE